jgi:hypothetical protein
VWLAERIWSGEDWGASPIDAGLISNGSPAEITAQGSRPLDIRITYEPATGQQI